MAKAQSVDDAAAPNPSTTEQAVEGEKDRVRPIDPITRARAMLALVGILVLGVLMIASVLLVGGFVRRRAQLSRGASRYLHPELRVRPIGGDAASTPAPAEQPDGE